MNLGTRFFGDFFGGFFGETPPPLKKKAQNRETVWTDLVDSVLCLTALDDQSTFLPVLKC